MAANEPVSLAFAKLVELGLALGFKSVSQLDGCAEFAIDDQWWCALNGHRERTKCTRGAEVPSFHAYVEFNGWPAGVISPRGGEFVAGAAANEDAFIAALESAIKQRETNAR